MAYYKINAPQKDEYTDIGMVNVLAAFYLEKGDDGYDKYMVEHYVQVPVIPKGEKYPGKVNEIGIPLDIEDYKKWVDSFPKAWQLNPFCNHFIQFEADVIKEEILYCFEFALAQTRLNYLEDDLHCEKGTSAKRINQDIGYLQRLADYRQPTTEMKLKISAAEAKTAELKNVDFTKVKTIAKYSVK